MVRQWRQQQQQPKIKHKYICIKRQRSNVTDSATGLLNRTRKSDSAIFDPMSMIGNLHVSMYMSKYYHGWILCASKVQVQAQTSTAHARTHTHIHCANIVTHHQYKPVICTRATLKRSNKKQNITTSRIRAIQTRVCSQQTRQTWIEKKVLKYEKIWKLQARTKKNTHKRTHTHTHPFIRTAHPLTRTHIHTYMHANKQINKKQQ